MYTSVIAHPTWLIRRDVFNRVGLYRDFYSCEDYDFLLRSRKKEIKMGNVKDVLLKYRVNQFSISNSNKSYQRLVSNFLRKNYERVEDITKEDIVDYIDSNMSFLSIFMSLVNSISLIQVLGTSYDRNYIYILGASINLLAGINGIYFVTLLYVIMFENFGDKKKWISGILSIATLLVSFSRIVIPIRLQVLRQNLLDL